MESNITRRKEGYFGVKYAHAHCQYNMAILMALLQAKNGLVSRKNICPGLQQDLHNCLVSQAKI